MSKLKRMSDVTVRRLILEALSRDDVRDAQTIVDSMVDMHEKAFALSEAVRMSKLSAVTAFLEAGSDPFLKHQGRTALVVAIRTDDVDCLKMLLDGYLPLNKYLLTLKDERRIQARVKRGINEVLFESAAVCAVRCLRFLLGVGADCNTYFYHDDEFLSWCTPLIAACYGPLSTVCRGVTMQNATLSVLTLIEHGADIGRTNHMGDTALHWAAGAALVDVVGILLRNGADVNHQNKIGKTALMTLCENYKEERAEEFLGIARMLLRQDCDVNLTDTDGWSALHFGMESRSLGLVRVLLEGGVDPNVVTTSSSPCMSCLSLAALHNTTQVVHLLLQYNACPVSDKTIPPFFFACEWQNLEMARLFYDVGVSPGDIVKGIDTALDMSTVPTADRMGWEDLRHLATEPPSLLIQCRTFIRRLLGRAVNPGHLQLPLPISLVKYLQLDI